VRFCILRRRGSGAIGSSDLRLRRARGRIVPNVDGRRKWAHGARMRSHRRSSDGKMGNAIPHVCGRDVGTVGADCDCARGRTGNCGCGTVVAHGEQLARRMSITQVEADAKAWVAVFCVRGEGSRSPKHVFDVQNTGIATNGAVQNRRRPVLISLPMSEWVREGER
jgi:hypothetical protein